MGNRMFIALVIVGAIGCAYDPELMGRGLHNLVDMIVSQAARIIGPLAEPVLKIFVIYYAIKLICINVWRSIFGGGSK